MNSTFQTPGLLPVCSFVCFVIFISCETDIHPDHGNNGGGNNTVGNFTPDELSGFLLLKDSPRKIAGKLPPAPNLQLGMSIKDTLYMMKGFYGTRVLARHNGSHAITGFYIAVSDSSYFDVSAVEAESEQFYSVFYIELVFPANANVDYPYSTPVKIQPHGPSGEPLNEFETIITIEDPEDEDPEDRSSSILGFWDWHVTLFVVDETARTAEAPGMVFRREGHIGGCCDGTYSTSNRDDPYCYHGAPDWTHVYDESSFWVTHYETMVLNSSGSNGATIVRLTTEVYANSLWTNYCTGEIAWDLKKIFSAYHGEHDFKPGNSTFTFNKISHNRAPEHFIDELHTHERPTRLDSISTVPRSTPMGYLDNEIVYTPPRAGGHHPGKRLFRRQDRVVHESPKSTAA